MGVFILGYLLAASRYPGGSWAFPGQDGFSWRHNYLCDLLDTRAVNGAVNTGRYWARGALVALCSALLLLWYHLPRLTGGAALSRRLMRVFGMAALGTTFFLSAGTHDLTVYIAGGLGTGAIALAIFGLWKGRRHFLAALGAWCFLIFLLNYVIYESGSFLRALPLIQKVTFSSFLIWLAGINLALLGLNGPKRGEGAKTPGSPEIVTP
nr:hypothetical protein [Robiginitalea marina]